MGRPAPRPGRSPAGGSAAQPQERLADRAWLREQHHEQGRSAYAIALALGVDATSVRRALRRHGLYRPVAASGPAPLPRPSKSTLRRQYLREGLSGHELARQYGVSAQTVQRWLIADGIPRRTGARVGPKGVVELRDKQWLVARYVDDEMTTREIAAALDCDAELVRQALIRHEIPRRGRELRPMLLPAQLVDRRWLREQRQACRSVEDIAAEVGVGTGTVRWALDAAGLGGALSGSRCPRLNDRRWLQAQYVTRGRSAVAIAAELGCGKTTVTDALHRLGIPTRSRRGGPRSAPAHRRGAGRKNQGR